MTYTYLVTALPSGRVGAKLVSEYITDLTPEEEKNRIKPESGKFFGLQAARYRPAYKKRKA